MGRRSTLGERFYFILNVFMVLMYFCGGAILYFWDLPSIPPWNRKVLSGIIVLYAIYRSVVLYRKTRILKDEN